jgi:hypothetical protein
MRRIFKKRVLEVAASRPGIKWFVVDGGPINTIDSTGAATLEALVADLRARGIRLASPTSALKCGPCWNAPALKQRSERSPLPPPSNQRWQVASRSARFAKPFRNLCTAKSCQLAENYMYEKLTVRCPADFDPIPVYISGAIRPADDDDGHGPFGAFSGIHLNPPAPCRRCERTRDLA